MLSSSLKNSPTGLTSVLSYQASFQTGVAPDGVDSTFIPALSLGLLYATAPAVISATVLFGPGVFVSQDSDQFVANPFYKPNPWCIAQLTESILMFLEQLTESGYWGGWYEDHGFYLVTKLGNCS